MLVCLHAPQSLLFPHVGCIVHHGGIGITAEALRAGRPQVVVPLFPAALGGERGVEAVADWAEAAGSRLSIAS